MAGIVAVLSIVATCVVLALISYVKRRRALAAEMRADSVKSWYHICNASNFQVDLGTSTLTALRNGSGTSISKPNHTLSSNADDNGAQFEPEMEEGVRIRANSE